MRKCTSEEMKKGKTRFLIDRVQISASTTIKNE